MTTHDDSTFSIACDLIKTNRQASALLIALGAWISEDASHRAGFKSKFLIPIRIAVSTSPDVSLLASSLLSGIESNKQWIFDRSLVELWMTISIAMEGDQRTPQVDDHEFANVVQLLSRRTRNRAVLSAAPRAKSPVIAILIGNIEEFCNSVFADMTLDRPDRPRISESNMPLLVASVIQRTIDNAEWSQCRTAMVRLLSGSARPLVVAAIAHLDINDDQRKEIGII